MNYTYYSDYGSYYEHYQSPNIVIVPTVHVVTMPQSGNINYSSVSYPTLVSDQMQPYYNTMIPESGANLMVNNGCSSYGSNSTAPLNRVAIQPPTTTAIDKALETIKPSCSKSNNRIQNNLITLTGVNSESSVKKAAKLDSLHENIKSNYYKETIKENKVCTENIERSYNSDSTKTRRIKTDHLQLSKSKEQKRNSFKSSKSHNQNYGDNVIESTRHNHKIYEQLKFKRIKTSSDYKKCSVASDKLKVSQQKNAATSLKAKDEKLTKSHKETLSPSALKRYLDYQNFLRKFNSTEKLKDIEISNSDRRNSIDIKKMSSHCERDKKKDKSISILNNTLVPTKRVVMSPNLNQNHEKCKSNKNTKYTSKNKLNSDMNSNEELPNLTELKKVQKDQKKNDLENKLYQVKKTLNALNGKKGNLEKEKRKRKSSEEPISVELKKKKEDYKKTRSHFTESKKKERLSEKFAPYLELRKKKEEKKKKMKEESRVKHCVNTDSMKKESNSETPSSYTPHKKQHEKDKEQNLKNKKFVRHEKEASTDTAFKKKSSKRHERTKKMQGSKSPECNAIITKTKSSMRATKRTREIHLKKESCYKREQFKEDSMTSNSTAIETEHNHAIRNVDVDTAKHAFSSYKIGDKMDLRTILMRKRAKNNASKLEDYRTETPERENFMITLQQDLNSNSKPTKRTNISSKSNVKKNKKVKLLISISCDSEESDNAGSDETNYCTSPFEDLSFLDDLNIDEIVDSLMQKGSASNESSNSVQRIQNLLKKDGIKKNEEANGVEKKRRLLNIHCDSIEILHSSDNENCTLERNKVKKNYTDSTNANVNSAPIQSIDDDIYEVIDITNDFENETIVIEHNVEELIEELFASPTKENRDTKNVIENGNTLKDDSKQHVPIWSKPDLETNLEKHISTASELQSLPSVVPFAEQKTENSLKETNLPEQPHDIKIIFEENMITQHNEESKDKIKTEGDKLAGQKNSDLLSASINLAIILNKQSEMKLEPETTSESNEAHKKINDTKQSISGTLSNETPCYQVIKNNDSFKDTTESENVIESKPDIINIKLKDNSKVSNNQEYVQNSNSADKNKHQDIKTLNFKDLPNAVQLQEKSKLATCNDNIIVTKAQNNVNNDVKTENVTVSFNTNHCVAFIAESNKCDVEISDVNTAKYEISTLTTNTTCKIMKSTSNLSRSRQHESNKTNIDTATESGNIWNTGNMKNQSDSKKNMNGDVLQKEKQNKSESTLELSIAVTAYIDKINVDLNKKMSYTKVIYKGHYSSIYTCKEKEGKLFAIKMLKVGFKNRGIHQSEILSLLNTSSDENNKYILNMMHTAEVDGRYFFLSEYYFKSCKDAMKGRPRGFHIDYAQKLAKQLISAVNVLAVNKIIHADINARHILLSRCGELKLCGFDRADFVHNIKILPNRGSPRFRAPEAILGFYPSFGIDVWATALLIFEMVTRTKLFTGHYNNEILYKQLCTLNTFDYGILEECQFRHVHFQGTNFIRRPKGNPISCFIGENLLRMKIFAWYNTKWRPRRNIQQVNRDIPKINNLCKLLQEMLMMDPRKRISIADASAHEFFHNINVHY